MNMKLGKYYLDKKFLVIIIGIVLLNFQFGLDIRFTIINILWILISIKKI
jgi:hypothetical protein